MRLIVFCVSAMLALPAAADPCHDEVAALFEVGGAMDPFQRPPHRMETTLFDGAGTQTLIYDNVIVTPIDTLSGVRGGEFRLTLDRDVWTGPGPDGPWTPAQVMFPEDRAGVMKRQLAEQRQNLTDVACHGAEDGLIHYSYTTQTDPDPSMGGNWFGSSDDIWIDPDQGQVVRWELTGFVSKFAAQPMPDRHVKLLAYDPDITLPERPE